MLLDAVLSSHYLFDLPQMNIKWGEHLINIQGTKGAQMTDGG